MKDKLLWGLIIVLLANTAYNWMNKPADLNLDYYKAEYKGVQNEINALNTVINTQEHEITRIKDAMVESDSTILNSSRPELDKLFTGFFNRVRLD